MKSLFFLLFSTLFTFQPLANEPASCHDTAGAVQEKRAQTHFVTPGMRFMDIDGTVHHFSRSSTSGAHAFIFMDTLCPITNRYTPTLNSLHEQAKNLGISIFGVVSDPEVSWDQVKKYRDDFGFKFPLLLDQNGTLGRVLKPTITPEVFLIKKNGELAYSGRVDNRFPRPGKIRKVATEHDFLNAMVAVSEGRTPEVMRTVAIGCSFEAWKGYDVSKVTYKTGVSQILDANCVTCHREGGSSPFPLQTYAETKRRARMIQWVTADRLMPPWRPDRGYGHFRDERTLTDYQIKVLEAWAEAGAPEGPEQVEGPDVKIETSDWRLGEPDLVLTMAEPYNLPANGEDIYRYFVLPGPILEMKDLVAIDFKAGDPSVVHHANFFVDYEGRGRDMDAADPEPGFSVFGTGGFMEYDGASAIGGWAPGADPYQIPDGYAIPLFPGDMLIEVHYHLSGRATSDQSSIGLYFADKPAKDYVYGLFMGTQDVDIPADAKNYRRHFWMDVPVGMTLLDLMPHMHYLGSKVEIFATLPDQSRRPIIKISEWDLRWQNIYVLSEALHLPPGSRIDAFYEFDNSAQNPDNPNHPPQDVPWGWKSDEEMAEIYLTVIPDDPKEADRLTDAARRSWMRSADPPNSKEVKDETTRQD